MATKRKPPREPKFKSKFENLIWNTLKPKTHVEYEPDKFSYTVPESEHKYTPDFKIGDKKYIETKGLFSYDDRVKMLLVTEQYPDVKFYICFQNANAKIRRGSETTYGDWCEKHGLEYCHAPSGIPKEWYENAE